MNRITKEIEIEDLVKQIPESVTYLMKNGIRCLQCGEPIWGTLETAAKEKSFDELQIEKLIIDLNKIAKGSSK